MTARCLVVGGARRLGAALAVELATAGVDVAVSSRSPASAAAVVARIEGLGRRGVAVGGDVTSRLDARHVIRRAATDLGGLDLLVYAASGPFDPTPPQEIDEAAWDASVNVIARGLLFCAQAAREVFLEQPDGARPIGPHGAVEPAPRHRGSPAAADAAADVTADTGGPALASPRRGTIVALTDIVTGDLWPRLTPHFAAKAAEIMVVRLLAAAWDTDGVAVCGVAPGPVELADDRRRDATERAARRLGYQRLLRPAEIAGLVTRCTREPALNGGNHVARV